MQEEWKDIKGFEGVYKISSLGRVKRIERIITDRKGRRASIPDRELNVYLRYGRPCVGLHRNKAKHNYRVDILVLNHFSGEEDYRKGIVTYKDGDRKNCSISNLKFVKTSNDIITRVVEDNRRSYRIKTKVSNGDIEFESYFDIIDFYNVNTPLDVISYQIEKACNEGSEYLGSKWTYCGAKDVNLDITDKQEEWRDVKGFEGSYEVSNLGRVRSVERTIEDENSKRRRTFKGRVLKLKNSPDGYLRVSLYRKGVSGTYRVHRLVADAFLTKSSPLKDIVNHKDGIRCNNNVNNLEWVNMSENIIHAFKYLPNNLGKRSRGGRVEDREQKQDLQGEVWVKIYQPFSNYLVSNKGRVARIFKNKYYIIQQTVHKSGYMRAGLHVNHTKKTIPVHRLVAFSFANINPHESEKVVNHIDGNKCNNCIENLEIVTKSENSLHSVNFLNKGSKKYRGLRISNGIKIFDTYDEIYEFIKETPFFDNQPYEVVRNVVRRCISGMKRTAYEYSWYKI